MRTPVDEKLDDTTRFGENFSAKYDQKLCHYIG